MEQSINEFVNSRKVLTEKSIFWVKILVSDCDSNDYSGIFKARECKDYEDRYELLNRHFKNATIFKEHLMKCKYSK